MKGDGHEEHPLVGRLVRDIDSGQEGQLMAVVRQGPDTTWRAYIRPTGGGKEIDTALNKVEPLGVT
ncbi:hypothetical protein ACH4TC_38495 [Streptomyces spororaveus]|uniref:hypothetical protein n=1 Tax=Streptomyces spororaveus TaxID=284039 RepID=UPI0037874928